mmetsp:Transcript_18951/g.37217  ORF Transcript_18951/g.37217 Transcript_18951/m.37217 type:complete len:262 (-) Transcript_18951:80-865(-)
MDARQRKGVLVGSIGLNAAALDGAKFKEVKALLNDVELDEATLTSLAIVNSHELVAVEAGDITNAAKPVLDKTKATVLRASNRSAHGTTIVVTAHNNVGHVKVVDSKVHNGKRVEVRAGDLVTNVTVHKELAVVETHETGRVNTSIRASNVEVTGLLLATNAIEELRVLLVHALYPCLVASKDILKLRVGSHELRVLLHHLEVLLRDVLIDLLSEDLVGLRVVVLVVALLQGGAHVKSTSVDALRAQGKAARCAADGLKHL